MRKITEIASMYYNMKEIYNIYLIKYNKKSANLKKRFYLFFSYKRSEINWTNGHMKPIREIDRKSRLSGKAKILEMSAFIYSPLCEIERPKQQL